ncbi:hypothetical protein [Hymenobacter tenuis]
MKKLICLLGFFVLSSCPVWAQADQPSVIVVRTIEVGNKLFVYTARGGQKAEVQELKFKPGNSFEEATAQYQRLIALYIEQGYALQSTMTLDKTYPNNTYIFVKTPKS